MGESLVQVRSCHFHLGHGCHRSVSDSKEPFDAVKENKGFDQRFHVYRRSESRTPDIGVNQNVRFLRQDASRMEWCRRNWEPGKTVFVWL
ncbi:MAG: hypothetical protein ABSF38_19330, partial [Verrucomicrobiota bacterium]